MKNRRTDISCRIKKAIVSVAINVATIVRELYAEDRKELITQISERKRRKYKVALHMVIHSRYWKHRYPLSYIPYLHSIFYM